jgi:hypothetical protein
MCPTPADSIILQSSKSNTATAEALDDACSLHGKGLVLRFERSRLGNMDCGKPDIEAASLDSIMELLVHI